MVTVDVDRNYVWSNKIDIQTFSPDESLNMAENQYISWSVAFAYVLVLLYVFEVIKKQRLHFIETPQARTENW